MRVTNKELLKQALKSLQAVNRGLRQNSKLNEEIKETLSKIMDVYSEIESTKKEKE